jgi:hypothetical protein
MTPRFARRPVEIANEWSNRVISPHSLGPHLEVLIPPSFARLQHNGRSSLLGKRIFPCSDPCIPSL